MELLYNTLIYKIILPFNKNNANNLINLQMSKFANIYLHTK